MRSNTSGSAWGRGVLRRLAAAGGALLLGLGAAGAQEVEVRPPEFAGVSHLVVPQARAFTWRPGRGAIAVTGVRAAAVLRGRTARTTLEVSLRNPGPTRAEAVLLLPVPRGAAVSGFDFEGRGAEPSARLLPRDEARRTYEGIVARLKDPALLEFAGLDLVRSSVFPVEPGGTQRVRLVYEELLPSDGDRYDYVLPRSESLRGGTPWDLHVSIEAEQPVATVYSPTHALRVERRGPRRLEVALDPTAIPSPGPFRLSVLLERGPVSASLFAYPDPSAGGGYFLLMAGLPATLAESRRTLRREVTVVLDRSGSMAGEKMDQATAAALQVIEGLSNGESFNIIDYSTRVETFASRPVVKDREAVLAARRYLAALRPGGGTNLHDALLEAVRQPPTPGALPIVLFLTDGLPTVGRTSEVEIRDMLAQANVARRRVFTFGVGADVNVPLLDRISDTTRATSTYVLPGEDVEVKVAAVFRRTYGPVLADLRLETLDEDGHPTTRAVRDLYPEVPPDLFEGDRLVVLGRYLEQRPLRFRLSGNLAGETRTFQFVFSLEQASTRNAFVPRLWASRKIQYLVDEIRQMGAEGASGPRIAGVPPPDDPRFAELRDEILRLSTEFGVLTEYTAFLATEGTSLDDWSGLIASCGSRLDRRAVRTRHGMGAVSQGRNFNEKKLQAQLDPANSFWNEANEQVRIRNVQQVADRAFFLRGRRWIDSRVILARGSFEPDEVVELGSPEHLRLVEELADDGRAGCLALEGEVLLSVGGKNVLVRNERAGDGTDEGATEDR